MEQETDEDRSSENFGYLHKRCFTFHALRLLKFQQKKVMNTYWLGE